MIILDLLIKNNNTGFTQRATELGETYSELGEASTYGKDTGVLRTRTIVSHAVTQTIDFSGHKFPR